MWTDPPRGAVGGNKGKKGLERKKQNSYLHLLQLHKHHFHNNPQKHFLELENLARFLKQNQYAKCKNISLQSNQQ